MAVSLANKITDIVDMGWWISEIDRHHNKRSWSGEVRKGHTRLKVKDATDVPHLLSKLRKAIKEHEVNKG
jgi:hypothetical protein